MCAISIKYRFGSFSIFISRPIRHSYHVQLLYTISEINRHLFPRSKLALKDFAKRKKISIFRCDEQKNKKEIHLDRTNK